MMPPAAPPTTAPRMAPTAGFPDAFPMAAPASAPPAAPIRMPASWLVIEAHPNRPNTSTAVSISTKTLRIATSHLMSMLLPVLFPHCKSIQRV